MNEKAPVSNNQKQALIELIDQFQKDLNSLHDEVLEARDASQSALENMNLLRNELTKRSIKILKG